MKVNLHANDENSEVEETSENTEEKSLPDVKTQDHVNVSLICKKVEFIMSFFWVMYTF